MLTHDFKLIDINYVSACAQYELDKNKTAFLDKMKHLALKGHPTAIAQWYKHNEIGQCEDLDARMKEYKADSFEELLAKGEYESHLDQNLIQNKVDSYSNIIKNREIYMSYEMQLGYKNDRQYLDSRIEAHKEDLKNNTSISYFRQACKKALAQASAQELQHYLLNIRAFEIMQIYIDKLPKNNTFDNEKKYKQQQLKTMIEKSLKDFTQEYKRLAKLWHPSQFPQYAFAYANLLSLYQQLKGKENKKAGKLIQSIYQDLAEMDSNWKKWDTEQSAL